MYRCDRHTYFKEINNFQPVSDGAKLYQNRDFDNVKLKIENYE